VNKAWAPPGAVSARARLRWISTRSMTRGSPRSPGTIRIISRLTGSGR
jgi:hypothetical protein